MGLYTIKNELVQLESKNGSGAFELRNDGQSDVFLNINNGYEVIVGIGGTLRMGSVSSLSINTINGEAKAVISRMDEVVKKINRKLLLSKN